DSPQRHRHLAVRPGRQETPRPRVAETRRRDGEQSDGDPLRDEDRDRQGALRHPAQGRGSVLFLPRDYAQERRRQGGVRQGPYDAGTDTVPAGPALVPAGEPGRVSVESDPRQPEGESPEARRFRIAADAAGLEARTNAGAGPGEDPQRRQLIDLDDRDISTF